MSGEWYNCFSVLFCFIFCLENRTRRYLDIGVNKYKVNEIFQVILIGLKNTWRGEDVLLYLALASIIVPNVEHSFST